jgi:hypothetical protein
MTARLSPTAKTCSPHFQLVADNLNALHHMEIEARERHDATTSAPRSLDLFNLRLEYASTPICSSSPSKLFFCKTMLDAMYRLTF